MKRPKIKLTLIDKKGTGICHRGHKIGDSFDYDTDRSKLCPMAMHVAFPYIDILRYGGKLPANAQGDFCFSCPDTDVMNIFRLEIETQNEETLLLKNALLFEEGHPRRTQHILKVHNLTCLLAESENLSEPLLTIVKAAAILHDIAIKPCKKKYGEAPFSLQQKEAPALVEKMLTDAHYDTSLFSRITYLVMMHHCYDSIEGMDFQILVEADLLVNIMEETDFLEHMPDVEKYFQTETGKKLLEIFCNY